jgi:micrococcal nuclease
VKVGPRDTDRYRRTVADVILVDGRILNHERVRAGLAWWYRKYAPESSTLAQLEAARDAKRGLWSQPNPVPPWEGRKTKGKAPPGEPAGKVIGNRRSRVDHKSGCPNAAAIAPSNCLPFISAEEAERAGYWAGTDCHPREGER